MDVWVILIVCWRKQKESKRRLEIVSNNINNNKNAERKKNLHGNKTQKNKKNLKNANHSESKLKFTHIELESNPSNQKDFESNLRITPNSNRIQSRRYSGHSIDWL